MSGFNLFQAIFILTVFFFFFYLPFDCFFLHLEKLAKVKKFLIKNLLTGWKRFEQSTHLNDMETVVEHIDQDNKNDKPKMASFLEMLFEIDPLQYKGIIANFLSALGKFDILFDVAFDGKIIFLYVYIKALVKC